MPRRQGNAGTGGHLAGQGVDALQGLKAPEAQKHLVMQGHPATHQTGVAALGNQSHTERPTHGHHARHSSVDPGLTTAAVRPTKRRVLSVV